MINSHRMTFIQTLHEVRSNLKQGSIVLVSLYPAIKYSQKQSITEQIQQILTFWLQGQKKPSYHNKKKQVSLDSNFAKLFPILYPFKLEQWLIQPQIPMHLINSYHLAPQTSTPSIFCQSHWIMVHIYMLKSLNSSIELTADIVAFLSILHKFNFIGFLAFYINNNEIKLQAKICKLVKSFKWKSLHTQKYLNFLAKSFGPRSLIKIMEDYIFIAEQYQKYVKNHEKQFQNLQINQQNKFKNSQAKKEVKAGLFTKRK